MQHKANNMHTNNINHKLQAYNAFCNANPANVHFNTTCSNSCKDDFEGMLTADYIAEDAGAVMFYVLEGELAAWLDYENMCGYL